MKRMLIVISLSVLISGCVTADKNSQSAYLYGSSVSDGRVRVEHYYEKKGGGLTYRFFQLRPDTTLLFDLFSNIVVDNTDSAFVELSANYLITVVEVENSSNEDIPINRYELRLQIQGKSVEPILPNEFPKSIECINWKGNLKNAYNLSVGTVTTVYVVASIVSCVKEGKCEGLRYVDDVVRLSQSGETDSSRLFSNPIFRTTMNYSKVMDLGNNIWVSAHSKVSGLVLYRRPVLSFNSEKITTSANCLVH